ncbi:uncharacterized protein LOC134266232 [Saccostrea cucullata]|uniref:uncharacterized protein LOC134266232 n=1 Tax=Saccostrea cuccullata TaxID=36930 RepID=UPI002ED178B0
MTVIPQVLPSLPYQPTIVARALTTKVSSTRRCSWCCHRHTNTPGNMIRIEWAHAGMYNSSAPRVSDISPPSYWVTLSGAHSPLVIGVPHAAGTNLTLTGGGNFCGLRSLGVLPRLGWSFPPTQTSQSTLGLKVPLPLLKELNTWSISLKAFAPFDNSKLLAHLPLGMLFSIACISFVQFFCISSREYLKKDIDVPGNCTGPEKCCAGYRWDEDASTCIKCREGYLGLNCEKKCPYPTYGVDCQKVCNCIESECDITYGCKKCDGLSGKICEEQCPYPTYGIGCQGKCHCAEINCDIKLGCTRGHNKQLDEKTEKVSDASVSNFTQHPMGALFLDLKREMRSYLIGIVSVVLLIFIMLLLVILGIRVNAISLLRRDVSLMKHLNPRNIM